ncbi:uncharacterized protein SRS1_14922 [Sporisorium reilianum f. sp. reilianum]|uniref:Ubinuclein middle domain-containing protein n=1 Tax=Sporisorium reilianum f. sp. reilianum TaxID=72559 RepID=A0A2N8UHU3_9BASI|nr:uncharacterized protein SRS1_14922 [Sporisorium reilianum f. sp. reilianum]
MNTRTSQAAIVDDDEEMPRSSAASRVSLANLLGPTGPGSSPHAISPRTSLRKRSSASADASGSNLRPPPETANVSNGSDRLDRRRSDVSPPQQPAATEPEQPFHDAEEHVPEDVAMADANEENAHDHEDDEDDEDDDDEDDEEGKGTTDAGSASEGEGDGDGDGDGDDKGEGTSSKDGAKSGEQAAAPKKRSRRRSPSPPEVVAPPVPKRPTVRIDILEARQSGYLINVPELVLAKLKDENHPWAKWYEEQLLEAAAEPEPVAPPTSAPEVPPGLEGFGGLAKLLAKYPSGEGSGAPPGASKKRRRPNDDKYDIGQYDMRDPFVDDSELNIDEPTHFAKPKSDGFYVTQGPVELAKAKALAKGQPIPLKDRPKPLSIRDSKFGFAGSLNKLVARKAQQGVELPPMPSTGSPSMQLGSLLNSGDPGSPSVSAASALTNAQRQEGTRDSPIKVDDNDSSSSKLTKKNRYPTLPVDPRLQAAFDELKKKVDAESFAVKTKFPPALKPPLVETAKLAVMLGEYDENFFNHLPTIFPYNRFTMMKLVKREFFPHHIKYFEDLKQEHLDKLGAMIRDSYPQQLADFKAAHKAWVERGEAPKDGEAAEASKRPKETNGADESMDVDGPKEGEDENIEPTKRWKWSEEMREEVFVLITIENAMSEIRNEKHKLENTAEQYSEINARKACYKQMFELFPEDGWTTSTNISREYAQIKKKKDRQEARGEELFADSRASSAVPA